MVIKYSRKWEKISQDTLRLMVFGGWLVRSQDAYTIGDSEATPIELGICFVPDPNHQWILEEGE